MKKYNFLITPVNGRNTGTEIYHSLKLTSLHKKIAVTDIREFSYGNHLNEKFYLQPFASLSEKYMETVKKIIRKEGIDVLIPGSDPELKIISRERKTLEMMGVRILINSAEVIDTCLDKNKTVEFLRKYNFTFPLTVAFNPKKSSDKEVVKHILNEMKYPFIIKPNTEHGGSSNTSLVQDISDWNVFYKNAKGNTSSFIAQEYIDAPEGEFTLGIMSDTNAKIISSFALRRDLTDPTSVKMRVPNRYKNRIKSDYLIVSTGISQGVSGDFKAIRKFGENVAEALNSIGPLNIQGRYLNGKFYIFEINPRFSATTFIRSSLGHNDVDLIFNSIVKGINLGQQKYKFCSVVRGKDLIYKKI
ncbi:MAG: ATP-grasp domain-containing protein [Candidatus Omnitrophica bacterium]|nr:ATP-grasp domain-containing protein [Candidatus Omnitrophota bacterium]